ncbi:P-loop containing nucleoside triphosphate hydrolase protein [Aspergillus heterothallicus]
MDQVYETLVSRALELSASANGKRVIVSLSGPPGSGKSTIAAHVVARLHAQWRSQPTPQLVSQSESQTQTQPHPQSAIVIPMDGFHHPKKYLDALPNRAEAYARRGAHWTFDASGVVTLIKTLRTTQADTSDSTPLYAPGFDHAIGDPVPDAICVTPDASFILVEGNYLAFDEAPWREIGLLVDESWFVDVDEEIARRRIAQRHMQSGIEGSWEQAVARAEANDLPNGVLIRERVSRVDVQVVSAEE